MLKPIAERPLSERTFLLGMLVGMAKESGYKTPAQLMSDIRLAWPHVPSQPSRESSNS